MKARLLIYCVVVMLLAWWPWNVWLILIAAAITALEHRFGHRDRA
jgi:hypothetical protein